MGNKPCPFCGSYDLFAYDYPFRRRPGLKCCHVECNNCGARGGLYETVDDAIKAWNERNGDNEQHYDYWEPDKKA